MSARYALYFVPADTSSLADFGFSVLGRDAHNTMYPPPTPDFNGRAAIVSTPRRYGFHATLKAPFELAADRNEAQLLAAVEAFADAEKVLPLTGLQPAALGQFCALVLPETHHADVNALASRCVQAFESFRRPLDAADVERRKPDELSPVQRDNLQRFGYPYVFDAFRFHMTLSGSMSVTKAYLGWLGDRFRQSVTATASLDRICVCFQPDRQAPFVRIGEYPFKMPG